MFRYLALSVRAGPLWWPLVLVLVFWCAAAQGQPQPTIVRVEQDWELVIGVPEPQCDAPQIVCVISPLGHVDSLHAAFELNQRSLVAYSSGGIQLQVWDGETPLGESRFPHDAQLSLPNETITWTQSMELDDGTLTFKITNGQSTTWGAFVGEATLRMTADTTLANLNAYDPEVSVQNSGVGFAPNRVQSLILKQTRLIPQEGDPLIDVTPRVIHLYLDPQ